MTELASRAAATQSPDADLAIRHRVRDMWDSVAVHWAEHVDYVDNRAADLTRLMIESVAPAPGERVLELACGVGSVGLAAATLVLPGGEIVMSDVAPEMTEIARRRATAAGLSHVSTRDLDLAKIDEPDAAYDVVFCREGLMFATDPEVRRCRDPAGAASRRQSGDLRVGAAGGQPVVGPGVRRSDGRDRRSGPAAGCAGAVLALRPGPSLEAVRAVRRRPLDGCRGAGARRVFRGMVGADGCPGRAAQQAACVIARGVPDGRGCSPARRVCAIHDL